MPLLILPLISSSTETDDASGSGQDESEPAPDSGSESDEDEKKEKGLRRLLKNRRHSKPDLATSIHVFQDEGKDTTSRREPQKVGCSSPLCLSLICLSNPQAVISSPSTGPRVRLSWEMRAMRSRRTKGLGRSRGSRLSSMISRRWRRRRRELRRKRGKRAANQLRCPQET